MRHDTVQAAFWVLGPMRARVEVDVPDLAQAGCVVPAAAAVSEAAAAAVPGVPVSRTTTESLLSHRRQDIVRQIPFNLYLMLQA